MGYVWGSYFTLPKAIFHLLEGDYEPKLPNSAGLPIKAKRRMADVAQAKRAAAAAKDEKEKRRKEKSRCPWLKKKFIAKFRV